jgi:hypothetical protein
MAVWKGWVVPRSARVHRGCLWVLLILGVLILVVPWNGIIWDGGFSSVECRLKFVDSTNKPVAGVTLTVLTNAGGECHFYPVDEFVPDRPVVSDAEGQMVFHHTAIYLEFSGHEYFNLIGMRFGETSSPHYDCVFVLDCREVLRTPFNFHRREWEAYRQLDVKRTWRRPWNPELLHRELDEGWRMSLFDCNHDGKLDREERVAANYFEWKWGHLVEDAEKPTEQTYSVVERTIVIPNP